MKNNKGITLIALIITIIVMLILVAVTVSVVVNSDLIGTAQGAKTNTEAHAVNDQTYGMNVNINGNIYTSVGDYTKPWKLTTDSGEPGLSVGDLITHKEKTTEQFYVIKVTGNTVAMLAAKNITTTGELKQSDSAPTVPFSNANYWSSDVSDGLDLNEYTDKTDNEKLLIGVVSTDAIEIARAYGDTFEVIGRLMTLEEIEAIGGRESFNDFPSFINEQYFWLGTSKGYNVVYTVVGAYKQISSQVRHQNTKYGVRPVLEVATSSIE